MARIGLHALKIEDRELKIGNQAKDYFGSEGYFYID